MGEGAGWSPLWSRAAHNLCRKKNTFSDEFLVLLQQWCYSLEPARSVLRLVLPCISPAGPHLGPRLPCQLGGARVELSLRSSRQRRVTDHLAEGGDTKNEPELSPRGLGAIYLPWDLPSSAGPAPGIPGQLCRAALR